MTYPAITQRIGTQREAASGIRVNRAVSGRPIFSRYSTQDWYAFRVQHECDATDMATILSHYNTNRMLEFDFTFDATGETYLTQYAERPRTTPLEGEDRWLVESYLLSTGRLPYGVAVMASYGSIVAAGESSSRRKTVAVAVASTVTAGSTAVGRTKVVTVSCASTVTCTKRKGAVGAATVSVSGSVSATGVGEE